MNKNPQESIESTTVHEQFESAKIARDYEVALDEAHRSASQGKFLASHVLGILQGGYTEGRAKMGDFPHRYPKTYNNKLDVNSVVLATNAQLKADKQDVVVGVYNTSYDGPEKLNVVVESIDGIEQPTSSNYDTSKAWAEDRSAYRVEERRKAANSLPSSAK